MKILTRSLITAFVASASLSAQAGFHGASYGSNTPSVPGYDTNLWSGWTQFDKNFNAINNNSGVNGGGSITNNTTRADGSLTNDGNTIRQGQSQHYDAEYLFYKFDQASKQLSIGLQTGFDIKDKGTHTYMHSNWYSNQQHHYDRFGHYVKTTRVYNEKHVTNSAGDIKLNFDNNSSGYNYAYDFGFATKTQQSEIKKKHCVKYAGHGSYTCTNMASVFQGGTKINEGGMSDAHQAQYGGLYSVEADGWDKLRVNSGEQKTAEWARKDGKSTKKEDAVVDSGEGTTTDARGNHSYFRTATFDMTKILGTDFDFSKGFSLNADWTISCYNDKIAGMVPKIRVPHVITPVSEPASIALFGLGLVGLGIARKKAKAKAA